MADKGTRVREYREYPLGSNHCLEFIWNRPDGVCAKLYHVHSESGSSKVYREIGLVVTFWEAGDAEIFADHWQAECYLCIQHLSDALIDELANKLLTLTECKEPFRLLVWGSDRTKTSAYRSYGQVMLPDDEDE